MAPSEMCWGILGAGRISADFARSLHHGKEAHRVVAVAARDQERAAAFGRELNLTDARAYGNYDELLEDKNVETVYIGVLNNMHAELSIRALRAGKNVLCEKPLAANARQVQEMRAAAKSSGKFLMEALWPFLNAAWRQIAEIMDSNELGALQMVRADLGAKTMRSNRLDTQKAETPLVGLGIYPIALAVWAFGKRKPSRIHAAGQVDPQGFDRWSNVTLEFGEGRHATGYCSAFNYSPTAATLVFEKGLIEVPRFFQAPERFNVIRGDYRFGRLNEKTHEIPVKEDHAQFDFNNTAELCNEADHLVERVRAGHTESDVVPLAMSETIAEILDEVRKQLGVVFAQDGR